MTEPFDPQEPDEGDETPLDPRLDALLGDALVWEEPPAELEGAVVAAVTAERDRTAGPGAGAPAAELGPSPDGQDELAGRRARRAARAGGAGRGAGSAPWVAGVAAAVALAVGLGVGVLLGGDNGGGGAEGGIEVALAGTDAAPGASAVADVVDTPQGTRIDLDVSGLPPAPDDGFYQAWLREEGEGGRGVSAGTFHLRGGDGQIELWAGVSTEQYPLLTVTLEQEDDGPGSSGEVVLRGEAEG